MTNRTLQTSQEEDRPSGGGAIVTNDGSPSFHGAAESLLSEAANQDQVSESAYDTGFKRMARKRQVATENNSRWYLQKQKRKLSWLWVRERFGTFWSAMYGFLAGLGIAGFAAELIGKKRFSDAKGLAYSPFLIIPFICSALANWWLMRKYPTEFVFDMASPPSKEGQRERNTKMYSGWRFVVNLMASALDALVIAGVAAYGAYEFLNTFGMTSGALLFVSMGIIGIFAIATFVPETALAFQENVDFFKDGFSKKYRNFKATLAENLERKLGRAPTVAEKNKYIAKFWFYFACAVVGMVFTALCITPMLSVIMPAPVAAVALFVITMFGISFYYNKAEKQILRESSGAKVNFGKAFEGIRISNAVGHALPALLGGIAMAAGPAGIMLGLVAAAAAIVASYIGNTDGPQTGYNKQVNTEYEKTNEQLRLWRDSSPENGFQPRPDLDATQKTMLFSRPFHQTEQEFDDSLQLVRGNSLRASV